MKQYQGTVRVSGIWIKTIVFAQSADHAQRILRAQFGAGNVLSTPTPAH
jgi:hypothetical protein